MIPFKKHLVSQQISVRKALAVLDELASDAILFVVDEQDTLLGSVTDGDFRRGFIKGLGFDDSILAFAQKQPKSIQKGCYQIKEIADYRARNFKILPVVDEQNRIVNVVNFRYFRSYLPLDAVIMAGGRGERLRPLTDHTPKPLLPVGGKPIIEHNVDRLNSYGVDDIWISVRYLGEQIQEYFKDGAGKSIRIDYIHETDALGTIGALRLAKGLQHDTVLVMNSDLLTNINFEDFYLFFEEEKADLAVACIPYQVNVPYGVMETDGSLVMGVKEKPTYTYYSNGGLYLLKRSIIDRIPANTRYDAPELIEELIAAGKRVVSYPLIGYWLDIGKHEDYKKAQQDIQHLSL